MKIHFVVAAVLADVSVACVVAVPAYLDDAVAAYVVVL